MPMDKTLTVTSVRTLIEKLEKYINDSAFIPASSQYRGIVILGLLSKALTVGRAVCLLVEADFHGEAFGLSRTLMDLFFAIRYISNKDTQARAKRFAEFYAKDHEGWTKIIAKFYPTTAIRNSAFHEDSLEIARNYKNAHQWTGLGDQTRQMALEDDSYERSPSGTPANCEFDYEALYKWTSFYVHGTVSSLDAHFVEARDAFRVRARIQLEQNLGSDALFNVVAFLHKSFISAFRALGYEPPEDILAETHQQMLSAMGKAEH
jgi:uncharacterized protein DUF5677